MLEKLHSGKINPHWWLHMFCCTAMILHEIILQGTIHLLTNYQLNWIKSFLNVKKQPIYITSNFDDGHIKRTFSESLSIWCRILDNMKSWWQWGSRFDVHSDAFLNLLVWYPCKGGCFPPHNFLGIYGEDMDVLRAANEIWGKGFCNWRSIIAFLLIIFLETYLGLIQLLGISVKAWNA